VEDVTKPRRHPTDGAHLPKVEEFTDYLFVIVNPLPVWAKVQRPGSDGNGSDTIPNRKAARSGRPQLSAILTPRILVTHHYADLDCIANVLGYVERHGDCGGRGPDFLFHLILDDMVDEYAPVVERIADELDGLEDTLFLRPSPKLLRRLLRLKRRVTVLRKTLVLEREVLARLIRGEFRLVEAREIAYYRNVYDHVVRYAELIESGREMVSDLMQTHLAAVSNRLNEIMKTLTMFSIIGVICTLIAGVYGMNFEHMPELKWEYGYYFALGLMAAAVVGSLGVFRWKKWL
jgi:magnesium transporter